MRIAAGVLAALGAALLAFGYWGLETAAGRRAYDEMDGMIPFGAGVLGAVLLVLAAVIVAIYYWRITSATER